MIKTSIAVYDKMRTTACSLSYLVRIPKGVEGGDQKTAHLQAFEIGLETSKVANESIEQETVVGSSKTPVDLNACIDKGSQSCWGTGWVYM